MSLTQPTLVDYKEKDAKKILGDFEEILYKNEEQDLSSRLCGVTLLILSGLNFVIGILLSCNNLLDLLIDERMKMRPGLPPMENWKNPKGHIKINIFLYNIENAYAFQNGDDAKLKLKEIGPIVYDYKVHQKDIVFEDDGTLSYSTIRECVFLEDENEPGIMNKTLTVINPMMVTLAAKTGNYFIQYLEDIYINRTIYDILWNGSTKFLNFFRSRLSYLLPTDNFGLLYNALKQFKGRYNVRIGPKNSPQDFWKIKTLNGKTKLGNYDHFKGYDDCPFSVVNATDGTGFPPYLTKNDIFRIVIERLPRSFITKFEKEIVINHINAYRFITSSENFMRTYDSKDCLGSYKNIELPSGVIDASILTYDSPISLSMPHFYGFNGTWETYLEGLSPNKEKHESYIILEPYTGIPIEGEGSLQSNSVFGDLNHLPKLKAFSNKIIPMFWLHTRFKDLGHSGLLYFFVYVLPVLQVIVAILFYFLSAYCCYLGIKKLIKIRPINMKFYQKMMKGKAILTQYNH